MDVYPSRSHLSATRNPLPPLLPLLLPWLLFPFPFFFLLLSTLSLISPFYPFHSFFSFLPLASVPSVLSFYPVLLFFLSTPCFPSFPFLFGSPSPSPWRRRMTGLGSEMGLGWDGEGG